LFLIGGEGQQAHAVSLWQWPMNTSAGDQDRLPLSMMGDSSSCAGFNIALRCAQHRVIAAVRRCFMVVRA
jgi:hypothetical protein